MEGMIGRPSHSSVTMAQFNVAEAKARFSELVQKALLGEEVIIAKGTKPVVKIVAIKPVDRKPGTGKASGCLRILTSR